MAKVYVDQDVCIGCEICANTLPEVFRMTGRSVAEAYDPEGATMESIQEVMDLCPVSCIHWD